MDRGDRADWFQSAWVCYFSAIALSAFVVLIVHEWRTPNPILQVKLITNRSFAIPTMLLIILTFTAYGMQILNPVFLQELLGYTAWKAGLAMAPRGIGVMSAMFLLGAIARKGYDTRKLVFLGYILIAIAQWELSTLDLSMSISNFVWPTLVQGVGMGLILSQLGNVVQSAVGDRDRSEAGGLQNTAQQLGSSLGTALLGAIVITGLIAAFSANVAAHPNVSNEVRQQVEVKLSAGGSFVASDEVRAGAKAAGLDPATVDALVESYEDAQLKALKLAFLVAALIVLASFWATRKLPTRRFAELQAEPDPPQAEPAPA